MTEIMRKREELFDDGGTAKILPVDAKRMALGIMQVCNGSGLVDASIHWIDHEKKLPVPSNGGEVGHYIAVLSGQVMCLVDDECPAFNTGEVWWCDPKHDAILLNKSGDDAVLLFASIRNE